MKKSRNVTIIMKKVGKTQYRLLLAHWERSHAQRELKAVVTELRTARTDNVVLTDKLETLTRQSDDGNAYSLCSQSAIS